MPRIIEEHVKDPGSAITHFIGMLMAIFAAVPLLLKAAREQNPVCLGSILVYAASLILLYAASTTYHTFNRSPKVNTILKKIDHMMISVLIAGSYTPILSPGIGRAYRRDAACDCVVDCAGRNPDQGVLGVLPEVGFLCALYWHGMDLRSGVYADSEPSFACRIFLAADRRNYLYSWRCDLRTEASGI